MTNPMPSMEEAIAKAYNDTLRAVTITGALTEGAVKIGIVSGVAKTISVTKVIEAKGNYAAEDVLSSDTATGDALPWTFSGIFRADNTGGYITTAVIKSETTDLAFRPTMYLYNVTPTGKMADNEANQNPLYADEAKFVGQVDWPALSNLGGMSVSVATASTVGNLPLWVDSASNADDLFGILVTRDAETGETAGDEFVVDLTLEQY
tara:strand:- start:11042 stop:11662 length:621 start_codon:yes stop_codon:yes gene_type:complete